MTAIEKKEVDKPAIDHRVLYHKKGYIRLEVPSLRKLSWYFLFMNSKKSIPFSLPESIRDYHINPLKGSIVITYDPDGIDILKYIKTMTSDPVVRNILKG
jgi:hypothetical protein